MTPSERCLSPIKSSEALKLKAYLCPAQVPTIGFGHTRTVTRADVKNGKTINAEEAERLLKVDLDEAATRVLDLVHVPMAQGQFDALVSFAFNIKGSKFNEQQCTLLRLVNQSKYDEAADEFDKWIFGGGKPLKGLVHRRSLEKKLFLSA